MCAGVILVFLCVVGDVFEECFVAWCALCVWTMEFGSLRGVWMLHAVCMEIG